jgi:hypothetical protein
MKSHNLIINSFLFIFILLSFWHLSAGFGKSTVYSYSNVELSTKEVKMAALLYNKLNLDSLGLSEEAYLMGLKGFEHLKSKGKLHNENVISIIDFSKPSSFKRLFIIDISSGVLLFNTYVAHGQNSGYAMAEKFSNKASSLQSSLGFYETSSTYLGKHGYSLKLEGLEKGINDNAMERAIVMHGASYVSEGMIKIKGYLGRSWGCPSVPEKYSKPIIDKIKNGSCIFIYANNSMYLHQSKILQS